MKRCSKCKKIIWPWQEVSDLNMGPTPIHAICHAKIIYNYTASELGKYIPISDLIELHKSNINKYIKNETNTIQRSQ